jgi:hypothetical protein
MTAQGQHAATRDKPARRADAGTIRLSQRDIDGLLLCGEHYGAPYDLLAAALRVQPERLPAVVARWRRGGYAATGRLGPGPAWCWLTRDGITATGLRFPATRPALGRLAHIRAVLAARLWLARGQGWQDAQAWWHSERRLRAAQPAAGRSGHVPDAEIHWPSLQASPHAGQVWAVEVELTPKPVDRTCRIMAGLLSPCGTRWSPTWPPRPTAGFFAERVFGPDRAALLAAQLPASVAAHAEEQARQAARLRADLARTDTAERGLIKELESLGDDTAPAAQAYRQRIRERFAELHEQRTRTQAQLQAAETAPATGNDPSLLDQLPVADDILPGLPDRIKEALFNAFDIQVLYRDDTHQATIWVTITDATPPGRQAPARRLPHRPRHRHIFRTDRRLFFRVGARPYNSQN